MHHTHDLDLSFLDDAPAAPVASTPVPEAWSTPIALDLMDAADAAVERFGSRGRDPEIAALADAVVAAHGRQDMTGVRAACSKITERAEALSKHNTPTGAAT